MTWVPRFGADRQPICNGAPTASPVTQDAATDAAPVAPAAEPPAPASVASAPAPVATPAPPAPARVTSAPVAAPVAPRATATRAAPVRRTVARSQPARKPAATRSAYPRGPNADGRHPDCPANAQFGRLVRMDAGKIMVMCVVSPELFPAGQTVAHAPKAAEASAPHAPKAAPAQQAAVSHAPAPHGRVLQAGSFRVAENAARLSAHLRGQGLPVHTHRHAGLTVVTVGPFADGAQAQIALMAVREAGIRDAFFR
ncbi:MAG: SPOR domain-containing protein [Roseinatronobacter sp.]